VLEARHTTLLISPYAADFLADAIYAPRATFLVYMTALPETGTTSWALTFGGDVAAQRGAWDEAEREYRRAAEMLRGADPTFQTLRDHIGRQLEALGR